MSEENTNGAVAPAEAATGPAFTIEKIYVKDVSFESPNSPIRLISALLIFQRRIIHYPRQPGCFSPIPILSWFAEYTYFPR